MIEFYKPGSAELLEDYGCAKVGKNFDQFLGRVGSPIDEVDHALHQWRLCMRCAKRKPGFKFKVNLEIYTNNYRIVQNNDRSKNLIT